MGYLDYTLISGVLDGDTFGYDDQGRLTATKIYLCRFSKVPITDSASKPKYAEIIGAIYSDPAIPQANDSLLTSAELTALGWDTSPYVTQVSTTPEDSYTFKITVTYGYKDNSAGGAADVENDYTDADKVPRYPWEQPIEYSNSRAGSSGRVLNSATLEDILELQEIGDSGDVLTPTTGTQRPWLNSAGDPLEDAPLIPRIVGSLNFSFNVRSNTSITYWSNRTYLDLVLKVNSIAVTIAGIAYPAGTLKCLEATTTSEEFSESRKWRPGADHPFSDTVTGPPVTIKVNTSNKIITCERFYSYYKITMNMQYDPAGFKVYILDQGYRQLPVDSTEVAITDDGATVTTINLDPINSNGAQVTKPAKLDGAGHALELTEANKNKAYYLKYNVEEFASFADLATAITALGL